MARLAWPLAPSSWHCRCSGTASICPEGATIWGLRGWVQMGGAWKRIGLAWWLVCPFFPGNPQYFEEDQRTYERRDVKRPSWTGILRFYIDIVFLPSSQSPFSNLVLPPQKGPRSTLARSFVPPFHCPPLLSTPCPPRLDPPSARPAHRPTEREAHTH